MSGANSQQADYWEERSASWLESEHYVAKISARFGPLAIDRLSLKPGQQVLDIGCGSGPTTLDLASRVGPDGNAVGVDISPSMIAAAVDRARSTSVANVRFAVADAQVDDLGASSYDAVFSRFGVMFFADPVAAFTNILQALRPGGRLAFACWQSVFANEWMLVPGAAVAAVTGELPAMPAPGEPGPFSMAEPGLVEAVLEPAGFTEIEVTESNDTVVVPEADIDTMVKMSTSMGPARVAIQDADDETRERLVDAVRTALVERVEHGEVRLSAAAFIVSARA